jgi:hypothetical protein
VQEFVTSRQKALPLTVSVMEVYITSPMSMRGEEFMGRKQENHENFS